MGRMRVALWSLAILSQAVVSPAMAGGAAEPPVPLRCATGSTPAQQAAAARLCQDVAQAITARYGVQMTQIDPDAPLRDGVVGLEFLTLGDHHISARLTWHHAGATVSGPVLDLSVSDATELPASALRNYAGSLVSAANFALTVAQ